MRRAGSRVTHQAYRLWATGATMAPDDPRDIQRMGEAAGDQLIVQQYRRIKAMARELQNLHGKLGRLLSAAMHEAFVGSGPHLAQLAKLLDGVDPRELLDEFELRAIRSIGPASQVPMSDLWKMRRPQP